MKPFFINVIKVCCVTLLDQEVFVSSILLFISPMKAAVTITKKASIYTFSNNLHWELHGFQGFEVII